MPNLCCVMGCRNSGHHFFPKDAELRNQWEIAVRRKNFKAKKHSKLCSDHFRDEDYIKEGFFSGMKLERKILKKGVIPSRFVWNEKEINKDEMRAQSQEKIIICDMPEDEDSKENVIKCDDPLQLIKTEIPEDTINLINTDMPVNPIDKIKTRCSIACDTNNDVEMNDVASKVKVTDKQIIKDEKLWKKYEMCAQRQEKLIKTDMPEDEDSKEDVIKCEDPLQIIKTEIPEDTINLLYTDMPVNPIDKIKATCDSNNDVEMNDVASKVKVTHATTSTLLDSPALLSRFKCHIGTQKNYQFFCIGTFMKNNKAMNFYTGFDSYEKFQFVLSTLCPEAHLLRYKWSEVLHLCVEDQFLLTLIKLRRNRLDFELAMLFDISPASVSNIFKSWVIFMHHKWSELVAKPRKVVIETCITEESTYPTSGTVAENASENNCGGTFNNQHTTFTVEGVSRLKDTTKTFHFLNRRKHKKYINLMTKARFVCQILYNFMEDQV